MRGENLPVRTQSAKLFYAPTRAEEGTNSVYALRLCVSLCVRECLVVADT